MVRVLAVLAGVVAAATSVVQASALGVYPSGATGYDISYPQCGTTYPNGSFGVVGVDHGRPFDADNQYGPNPCLASEYAHSSSHALYLNTGYDPTYVTGHSVSACVQQSQRIPGLDVAHQQAWEVGCAQAWFNEQYALGTGTNPHGYTQQGLPAPKAWWLDVETANSWSTTDLSLNSETLQGAVTELKSLTPQIPVGVYSTSYQWGQIAGPNPVNGFAADWVATGQSSAKSAKGYCSRPFTPGTGVWLVQYVSRNVDRDYAC